MEKPDLEGLCPINCEHFCGEFYDFNGLKTGERGAEKVRFWLAEFRECLGSQSEHSDSGVTLALCSQSGPFAPG